MQRWGPQRRVSWKPAGFHRIKWEKSVSGPFPTFNHRNIMWFPCLGNKPTNCRFFIITVIKRNLTEAELRGQQGCSHVEPPAVSYRPRRGTLPRKESSVMGPHRKKDSVSPTRNQLPSYLLSPWETIITLNLLFFLNAFSLKVTLPTSSFFSTK